ncbi:MAG TPA: carbonic anhydrase [Acetobacteraceae bacterium]|nr:carbonic anhydrase [Acetobacteraceae bacterium]
MIKAELLARPGCRCGCDPAAGATLHRRRLLVGAAIAMTAAATTDPAHAQTPLTPQQALDRLMAGNRRFVEQRLTVCNEDLEALRRGTAARQEPFAAVLACADSRVPVELVFDQSIGRLFVARVAGNIASAEIIASLEYGAAVLGTKVLMVLGHAACGAVTAAIEGKSAPGQISALYGPIHPAVVQAGPDLGAVIRENARLQARLLRDASPVIGELVRQHRLAVHAGYYDLASGIVTLIEL